jgi:hypothetical protein
MLSTRYSWPTLIKFQFPRQNFEKYLNTKFHENPTGGSRVVHADKLTDRDDEANNCFWQ